jgi:hypothetical protein
MTPFFLSDFNAGIVPARAKKRGLASVAFNMAAASGVKTRSEFASCCSGESTVIEVFPDDDRLCEAVGRILELSR